MGQENRADTLIHGESFLRRFPVMMLVIMILFVTPCVALPDDGTVCPSAIHGARPIKELLAATTKNDFSKVYELELPGARAGYSQNQFEIGYLLIFHGIPEVPKDEAHDTALIWLRKSAYGGCSTAMFTLSGLYEKGWGGLPQDDRLTECFSKAAWDTTNLGHCKMLEEARIHPYSPSKHLFSSVLTASRTSP